MICHLGGVSFTNRVQKHILQLSVIPQSVNVSTLTQKWADEQWNTETSTHCEGGVYYRGREVFTFTKVFHTKGDHICFYHLL